MSEDEEGAVEEKAKERTYADVKDLSYAQSTARAVPQGLMSLPIPEVEDRAAEVTSPVLSVWV